MSNSKGNSKSHVNPTRDPHRCNMPCGRVDLHYPCKCPPCRCERCKRRTELARAEYQVSRLA